MYRCPVHITPHPKDACPLCSMRQVWESVVNMLRKIEAQESPFEQEAQPQLGTECRFTACSGAGQGVCDRHYSELVGHVHALETERDQLRRECKWAGKTREILKQSARIRALEGELQDIHAHCVGVGSVSTAEGAVAAIERQAAQYAPESIGGPLPQRPTRVELEELVVQLREERDNWRTLALQSDKAQEETL